MPGPGSYNQDLAYGSKNSIGATSSLLRERSHTQQAIRSQTQAGKRSATLPRREIKVFNIVQYDTDSMTIQGDLKKKIEAIRNPALAGLTKTEKSLGFNSTVPRWKDKSEGSYQESCVVGPGYHETSRYYGSEIQLTKKL